MKPLYEDKQSKAIRLEGKFWTPPEWAEAAIRHILDIEGEDYFSNTVVYDPCCGGGNLTRAIKNPMMAEVLSTLEEDDLSLVSPRENTTPQVVFQQDFLNDPTPDIVNDVMKVYAKEGVRLLFLMNPPYVRPGKVTQRWGTTISEGITDTAVKLQMGKLPGRQQAYIQFIWQCINLAEKWGFKDYDIGIFAPINYLHRPALKRFREWLMTKVARIGGFAFSAAKFEALVRPWTLYFSLFRNNTKGSLPNHDKKYVFYPFVEQAADPPSDSVLLTVHDDTHEFLSHKLVNATRSLPTVKADFTIGAIDKIKESKSRYVPSAYWTLTGISQYNIQNREALILTSGPFDTPNSIPVEYVNIPYCAWLFCATRVPAQDFLGEKEEVRCPATLDSMWLVNALVWMSFNKQNNCFSMLFNGYRMYNHLFWWSEEEILSMGLPLRRPGVGRDVNVPYDNGVPLLKSIIDQADRFNMLWPETQDLLAEGKKLWLRSIPLRTLLTPLEANPNQCYLWDAGYAQCRKFMHALPGGQRFTRQLKWDVRKRLAKELLNQQCFGIATDGIFKRSKLC